MPFAMTGNAAILSQMKTQTKRQRGSKSVFVKASRQALASAAGNLVFQPLGSQPPEGPGSVGRDDHHRAENVNSAPTANQIAPPFSNDPDHELNAV